MTFEEAANNGTLDRALDKFRASYNLATEQDAARAMQDLFAQGATVAWAEYQVQAFIEQRLADRELAVATLRAQLTDAVS